MWSYEAPLRQTGRSAGGGRESVRPFNEPCVDQQVDVVLDIQELKEECEDLRAGDDFGGSGGVVRGVATLIGSRDERLASAAAFAHSPLQQS